MYRVWREEYGVLGLTAILRLNHTNDDVRLSRIGYSGLLRSRGNFQYRAGDYFLGLGQPAQAKVRTGGSLVHNLTLSANRICAIAAAKEPLCRY